MVRLSTLDKKLLRDLWRMRGQLAAVALVAMCGTATFITMAGAYDALVAARDNYYRDYRFAQAQETRLKSRFWKATGASAW